MKKTRTKKIHEDVPEQEPVQEGAISGKDLSQKPLGMPFKKKLTQSEYAKMSRGCKGNKATKKEVEERVYEMADWLLRWPMANKFKIRAEFCPKFGILWRQCDVYSARAKALNEKRVRMDPQAAADFGDAVLIDLLSGNSEKIRAVAVRIWQDRHGYAAPSKTSIVNPDGSSIFVPLHVNPADIVGEGKKKVEAEAEKNSVD